MTEVRHDWSDLASAVATLNEHWEMEVCCLPGRTENKDFGGQFTTISYHSWSGRYLSKEDLPRLYV